MPWNEADRERYNMVRERYTSGAVANIGAHEGTIE